MGRADTKVCTVTSSAIQDLTPTDAGRPHIVPKIGTPKIGRGGRSAVRVKISSAVRSLYACVLSALYLVCAVLPLLSATGESPRGFEVRPVLASSNRLPVSEASGRAASTALDVDDLHEDMVPPRAAGFVARTARRPVLPHLAGVFRTWAGTPPDRPPRLTDAV